MSKLIMVTGGARSGKSTFAENHVTTFGDKILYIATAIPFDDGMKDRVKKHQQQRPSEWSTVEQYKSFQNLEKEPDFMACEGILFDCMTMMVTNLMLSSEIDFDHTNMTIINQLEKEIIKEVDQLLKVCKDHNKKVIFVTNEVGLGLVPSYKLGNYFRDIAGRINQRIAGESDEVYFIVSGIPMKIK